MGTEGADSTESPARREEAELFPTAKRDRPPRARPTSRQETPPAPHPVVDEVLKILRADPPDLSPPPAQPVPQAAPAPSATDPIPARMLNEFVYCPRLFYYEHVEGLFVHNADTLRGAAIHTRVDAGSGALPAAQAQGPAAAENLTAPPGEQEVIHSRSVTLASDRVGVTAKMDLVEVRTQADDLFAPLAVCPVDYKAGSPKPGPDGNALWDTDRMQLGLQCLILRDNGYACTGGVIYYRGSRQRVPLDLTPELETWILQKIAGARATAAGPIPPPLVDSPKCHRCSLAPICLPDETTALARTVEVTEDPLSPPPRRLMAPAPEQRALYLNTPGLHVGRSDEVLQIRDRKNLVEEIRLQDVHHVALFGNIQISTQAVQKLCDLEIPVTYFSGGGWFYGITRGHGLKNIFTRISQFRVADIPAACLDFARRFVSGKIRNQRTLLMRNHLEPPTAALLRLRQAAHDALAADSIPTLLGIEGAAAALYFAHFNGMLKPPDPVETATQAALSPDDFAAIARFDFHQRNRRPPRDPINALLSLAYSLLAKDCTLAALAVGFDSYLGFFHQPRFGRPALALDLMEEFRPLVADSTVLTLINNRMLTPAHFVTAGQAVNLTREGRSIAFQAYERRINQTIIHPLFDYKVCYRRAIELQARLLARCLTGEIAHYRPFLTR